MPRVLQVARGALAAGLIAALLLALALMLGLAAGTSFVVYPATCIGAVLFVLIPRGEAAAQILGAGLVGLGAVALGVWNGFGPLEYAVVGGSMLAMVVAPRELSWPAWLSLEWLAVVAVAIAVVNLIPLVLDGGGLNHDESAYALKARHWIEGTPETGWNLHRGIAMSGYGFVVLEMGGSEGALRLWGIAAIIGLIAATWVLGRRMGGRLVGPLAAMAIVASPTLLRRSTEYLSDVPSAALLVACMIVLWREFADQEAPSYRILWLLPFALAAFYIRYQSLLSFALIAVAVGVLFRDKVVRGWKPVALTGVIGLIGLVPHFIFSISETGSPIGILLFTARVAGREFLGEGLIDYFLLMGWPLAAFVGPVATVFFVWWVVKSRKVAFERQRSMFLLIPTAGQVLILGVLSHGEARFIFFPLALTLIGGIIGFFYVSRDWRALTARAVSFGLIFVLIGSLAMSASHVRRAVADRAEETEVVLMAAETARGSSGDRTCGVMTSYQPQITFYSACTTAPFRTHLDPEDALARFEADDKYLLLVDDGKRQPEGSDLDALLAETLGPPIEVDGGEGQGARLYVFADG